MWKSLIYEHSVFSSIKLFVIEKLWKSQTTNSTEEVDDDMPTEVVDQMSHEIVDDMPTEISDDMPTEISDDMSNEKE